MQSSIPMTTKFNAWNLQKLIFHRAINWIQTFVQVLQVFESLKHAGACKVNTGYVLLHQKREIKQCNLRWLKFALSKQGTYTYILYPPPFGQLQLVSLLKFLGIYWFPGCLVCIYYIPHKKCMGSVFPFTQSSCLRFLKRQSWTDIFRCWHNRVH